MATVYSLRENANTSLAQPNLQCTTYESSSRTAIKITDQDFLDLFSEAEAASKPNHSIQSEGDRDEEASLIGRKMSSRKVQAYGNLGSIRPVNRRGKLKPKNSAALTNSIDRSDQAVIGEDTAVGAAPATPTGDQDFYITREPPITDKHAVRNWLKDHEANRSSGACYNYSHRNIDRAIDKSFSCSSEQNSEQDSRSFQQRDPRDVADNCKALETREISKVPRQRDVITIDEDIRDWLRITGYLNVEERARTLNHHRAIAALETPRSKFLKGEQFEDSNGLETTTHTPPIIFEHQSTPASDSEKSSEQPVRSRTGCSQASVTATPVSKRVYSRYIDSPDMRAVRDREIAQLRRPGGGGRGIVVKTEPNEDGNCPFSRDHNSPQHVSASPSTKPHGVVPHLTRSGHYFRGRSYDHNQDRSSSLRAHGKEWSSRPFYDGSRRPSKGPVRAYKGRNYKPYHRLSRSRVRRGAIE